VDEAFVYAPDYGNFCISALSGQAHVNTNNKLSFDNAFFDSSNEQRAKVDSREKAIATVGQTETLAANKKADINFVVSWYFPNLTFELLKKEGGRYYANKFKSSQEVAR